jgi:hypothetical protein
MRYLVDAPIARRGRVAHATAALFLESSQKISRPLQNAAGAIPGAGGPKRSGQVQMHPARSRTGQDGQSPWQGTMGSSQCVSATCSTPAWQIDEMARCCVPGPRADQQAFMLPAAVPSGSHG